MIDLIADANKWEGAACTDEYVDPDMFFDRHQTRQAIEICKTCPLRLMCAEYAITNEISEGVWGGLSEDDRKNIKRTLKLTKGRNTTQWH